MKNKLRSPRGESAHLKNGNPDNLLSEVDSLLASDIALGDSDLDIGLSIDDFRPNKRTTSGAANIYSDSGINAGGFWGGKDKPRDSVRGKYVLIPREFLPYFRAIFAGLKPVGQRRTWAELLYVFGRSRVVLVEVQNRRRKKTWFGVFRTADICIGQEKLLYLITADIQNGMSYDLQDMGIGGFDLLIRGTFASTEDCMDYREYLINRSMDKGWGTYNSSELAGGTVKRFISVELDQNLVSDLLAAVGIKKIKIRKLLTGLVKAWVRKVLPDHQEENSRDQDIP